MVENIYYKYHILPPDETGLLDTGTAHGPLVEGGAVGDGPQRLPGHVRPLRGGEDGPGVPGPDQPLHVPDLALHHGHLQDRLVSWAEDETVGRSYQHQ